MVQTFMLAHFFYYSSVQLFLFSNNVHKALYVNLYLTLYDSYTCGSQRDIYEIHARIFVPIDTR